MRKEYKKVVVKVGTTTITHPNGAANINAIDKLIRVLADLHHSGKQVILVTSGAIGIGRAKMGLKKKPDSLQKKQALAAIGQVGLMHIYSKLLAEYGVTASQILLTRDILTDTVRKNNAMNTINQLLEYHCIPIVNENDTVSVEEINEVITFGDNDTLAANVSFLINADILILLSDINGLYTDDPRKSEEAELIPIVTAIDETIENSVHDSDNDGMGTGGMTTKVKAGKFCMEHGIVMAITNGTHPENIYKLVAGEEVGTLFIKK
jgi:glutamate 5-kinase